MFRVVKFFDTAHAQLRSDERILDLDAMKKAVNHHDNRTQQYRGDHGGFVYKFKKTSGQRTLVVVAEVKNECCWLISGWIEDAR